MQNTEFRLNKKNTSHTNKYISIYIVSGNNAIIIEIEPIKN